jgi:hypothetical protein
MEVLLHSFSTPAISDIQYVPPGSLEWVVCWVGSKSIFESFGKKNNFLPLQGIKPLNIGNMELKEKAIYSEYMIQSDDAMTVFLACWFCSFCKVRWTNLTKMSRVLFVVKRMASRAEL